MEQSQSSRLEYELCNTYTHFTHTFNFRTVNPKVLFEEYRKWYPGLVPNGLVPNRVVPESYFSCTKCNYEL